MYASCLWGPSLNVLYGPLAEAVVERPKSSMLSPQNDHNLSTAEHLGEKVHCLRLFPGNGWPLSRNNCWIETMMMIFVSSDRGSKSREYIEKCLKPLKWTNIRHFEKTNALAWAVVESTHGVRNRSSRVDQSGHKEERVQQSDVWAWGSPTIKTIKRGLLNWFVQIAFHPYSK